MNSLTKIAAIPHDNFLSLLRLIEGISLFAQPIYVGITKKQTLYDRYLQHMSNYENETDEGLFGCRLKKTEIDWDDLVFTCIPFKVGESNEVVLKLLEKYLQALSKPVSDKQHVLGGLMESGLRKVKEAKEYDFEKNGSFGRFLTKDSFPLEFVMTSFTAHELKSDLSFARDIRQDKVDFEMLIQRGY